MDKQNILVFPCGSEIGLEIYRSLEFSTHFNLIGASSVADHGEFVFENYIGKLPFVTDVNFIETLKKIVVDYKIDAIYPAMDLVINKLKKNENELGCKVISSNVDTTSVCLSKSKTYEKFKSLIQVPKVFQNTDSINTYPIFLKPDIGYGSRGVLKATNLSEVQNHIVKYPNTLLLEYLPGKEFTIDCFTNFKGELLFVGPRERRRISNGISVNTKTMSFDEIFYSIAEIINNNLELNGAWFFQVKENQQGEVVLMEIASRLGGSSAVYRAKGVNFAILSLFNAFEIPVAILENDFEVEMDRALDNCFLISKKLNFQNVYLDFNDLIIESKVNIELIGTLHQFINHKKNLYLFVRRNSDLEGTFKDHGLKVLFKSIIEISEKDFKWEFIDYKDSIFIDNSFLDRTLVKKKLNIPVFSLDMIVGLGNIFNK